MKPPERGADDGPGEGAGGDTKVCPYCAETIRAAAIKCRYCQSDLTPDEPGTRPPPPTPPPTPAFPQPPSAAAAEATTSAEPAPHKTSTERGGWSSRIPRLGRVPWAIGAIVLVTTLALLLLALRDWREHQEIDDATKAGEVARAAAADKVESLLSYRYESFDDDVTAAQKMLTPSFRDEYAPTVAEIRKRALAQRRDQQAEVLSVGLVSSDEDRVRTLVFVNTVSARQGSDRPATVMQNRVTVDLVRSEDGEDWLIDDLSFPST